MSRIDFCVSRWPLLIASALIVMCTSGCVGIAAQLMYMAGMGDIPAEFDGLEGKRVAVVGLGPIGLMLCACVADAGGRPVGVGSRPERRELAPAFGAVPAEPDGADVAIEAAGTVEAWGRALSLVRPGGTVLAFGGLPRDTTVPVDPYRIHYEEVRLVGSFHHTPRHVRAALAFLSSGAYPFERLVTHEVGLEGVARLFDDPPRDYLKAAVRP